MTSCIFFWRTRDHVRAFCQKTDRHFTFKNCFQEILIKSLIVNTSTKLLINTKLSPFRFAEYRDPFLINLNITSVPFPIIQRFLLLSGKKCRIRHRSPEGVRARDGQGHQDWQGRSPEDPRQRDRPRRHCRNFRLVFVPTILVLTTRILVSVPRILVLIPSAKVLVLGDFVKISG